MKLVTKQQHADRVFDAMATGKNTRPEIKLRLTVLLPNPTAEQLADCIPECASLLGNFCEECGQDVRVVVEIGEELNHDSRTTWVCVDCLRVALEMIKNELSQP